MMAGWEATKAQAGANGKGEKGMANTYPRINTVIMPILCTTLLLLELVYFLRPRMQAAVMSHPFRLKCQRFLKPLAPLLWSISHLYQGFRHVEVRSIFLGHEVPAPEVADM